MSGALQAVFQNQRSFTTAPNSDIYTTAGTYSWVAPTGVTSVSVLVVSPANGYKGGALAYKNNYSVTPGNSYTVFLKATTGDENVYSYFVSCATVGATANAKTGDGGGLGGGGSGPGGSGAGGYSGNGGAGSTNTGSGANGSNGAGGGGGGGASRLCTPGDRYLGGGGGGVGIYGQGSSGTGGTFGALNANGGTGGSCGTSGTNSTSVSPNTTGGLYGGARGESDTGSGARGGAIRIVWPGASRSFPSTCVGLP